MAKMELWSMACVYFYVLSFVFHLAGALAAFSNGTIAIESSAATITPAPTYPMSYPTTGALPSTRGVADPYSQAWNPGNMFYVEPANVSSYCVASMMSEYWKESARCPAHATATTTVTWSIATSDYDYDSYWYLNQPDFAGGVTALTGLHTETYELSNVPSCHFSLPTPTGSPCCGKCTVGPHGGNNGMDWVMDFTDPLKVFYWPTATSGESSASSTIVNSDGFTFVSPSWYFAIHELLATDYCSSTLGPVLNTTFAVATEGLSTARFYSQVHPGYLIAHETDMPRIAGWYPMTVSDYFSCFGTNHTTQPNDDPYFASYQTKTRVVGSITEMWNPCKPWIKFPTEVLSLAPEWSSCTTALWPLNDPPIALTANGDLVPAATPAQSIAAPTPSASSSIPEVPQIQPQSAMDPGTSVDPIATRTNDPAIHSSNLTPSIPIPVDPTSTDPTQPGPNSEDPHTSSLVNSPNETPPSASEPISNSFDPTASIPSPAASQPHSNSLDPAALTTTHPPIFSAGSHTFTILPSGLAVNGITLTPGGAGTTIDGIQLSLGSSDLVIGTRTETWATGAQVGSSTEAAGGAVTGTWALGSASASVGEGSAQETSTSVNLGAVIMSGLGQVGGSAIGSGSVSASGSLTGSAGSGGSGANSGNITIVPSSGGPGRFEMGKGGWGWWWRVGVMACVCGMGI